MQVTRLRLKNHVGVLEGTGRSEIEVDFRAAIQEGLKKVFLFGRNGSGKSTILNSMNPFPESFDDRSVLIVPGREGLKEIEYLRPDGSFVLCEHRWASNGKLRSFMYVSQQEMFDLTPEEREPFIVPNTAKGNITEFRVEVAAVLGIDKDYLKIGRVGGSVSSVIDMSPTDRKKFIGKLLPSVEPWAVMYKNASARQAVITGELRGLQKELDKVEPIEALRSDEARLDAEVRRLRDESSRADAAIGEAEGAMSELLRARDAILDANGVEAEGQDDFNPLRETVKNAEADSTASSRKLEELFKAHPKLREFGGSAEQAGEKLAEMRDKVARREARYEAATEARSASRKRVDAAIRVHTEAAASLRDLQGSGEEIESLRAQRPALAEKVNRLTAESATLRPAPEGLGYDDVRSANEVLSGLRSEIESALSSFESQEVLSQAIGRGMDPAGIEGLAAIQEKQAKSLKDRLGVSRARLATVEGQAQFYERFKGQHCNNPRCPHESHIEQFASAPAERETKKSEIRGLEQRQNECELLASSLRVAASGAKTIRSIYERVRRHAATYRAAGLGEQLGSFESFLGMLTGDLEELSIDWLVSSLSNARDLSEARRQLETLDGRISGLEQLQSAEERVRAEVERAEAALTEARAELATVDAAATDHEKRLLTERKAADLLQQLQQALATIDDAARVLDEVREAYEGVEALRGRWQEAEGRSLAQKRAKVETSRQLVLAERGLTEVQAKVVRRRDYEGRVLDCQGKLEVVKKAVEGAHPAKGAPVHFIRGFLDRMRGDVNQMLDEAFGGELRLDFRLSESEFSIPVTRGSGNVIPDVSETSDGQQALAKTVLSLVLVKQTLADQNGYNVVTLDEIDGPLDKERNRERFASIVDRFIEEMGLEQVMIISHNDAFHSSPAGVILLPGHATDDSESFLSNKVVLADFS